MLTPPSTPGTYYYGAMVDPVSGETNTSNNTSSGVSVVVNGTPDLIVSLEPEKTRVSPGERIKLTATIENIGTATAVDPRVHYYRSNDSTIDPNDNPQGDDEESDLPPGSSGTESVYVTAPSTPGTYYYGAMVDPVSGETNTSNNTSSGVSVVVNGTPDLIVSLEPEKTRVSPGERITLTATIENIGTATAVDPRVHYYRSNDSTIDPNDNPQGDDEESDLPPGSSGTESVYVTAPSTPGTYYYGAIVDPVSGETNTSNNTSSGVSVVVKGTPDLIVSLEPEKRSVSPSEVIKLTATIENIGTATAVDPRVHYYRSNDSTIDPNDNHQGDDEESDLPPGSSGTESVHVTAPSTPGTYYYGAMVDSVSGETNTSNNTSSGVSVVVSPPDNVGDTADSAKVVSGSNSEFTEYLHAGDEDWYKIYVPTHITGLWNTLLVYTTGGTDTKGELYGLNFWGNLESSPRKTNDNIDSDNKNFHITEVAQLGGWFYIKVTGTSASTSGYYNIVLRYGLFP